MILNIPGVMPKSHPRDPFGARLERRFPLRCHEGEMATHRRLERAIEALAETATAVIAARIITAIP